MTFLSRYFKKYLKESIIAPVFKLLEASFELLVPLIIAHIVDIIIPNGNQGDLIAMLFLLILLASIGVSVSLIAQFFSAKVAVGVTKSLTEELYQKILSLPKSNRNGLNSSSLLTRMMSDIVQIQTGINIFLRLFLRAPIVVFGSLLMAFYISPRLSMYFLMMIVILLLIVVGISQVTNHMYQRIRQKMDTLVSQVRETATGWRVIRAFGQVEREIKQFQDINTSYKSQQIQVGMYSSILTPLTFFVVNTTVVILIWQGKIAISTHLLEQGMLIALINYLLQILVELVKLVMVVSTLHQAYISMRRIQEVFEQDIEDITATLPVIRAEDRTRLFSVSNLSFTYAHSTVAALSNITFEIAKGECIGIIGGTGAGKSTLIDILLGFYPISQSHLSFFIDGNSPQNLKEWRQQFAIVPQQTQLFAGTIRSNLTLGRRTIEVSDEDIWEALEVAQAHEFVRQKGGLDTVVEAFGKNFSGGQVQRLAIARALLQGAPILVLDDATSALDYLTERRLLQALRNQMSGQTIIMVSQRIKSLRLADNILVLEKGRQVGFDTHEALLKNSAIYQEIHHSQEGGR